MGLMNGGVWQRAEINGRVTILENKWIRSTRFASIGAGTSGSIALPAASTVVLDDFGGTVDAVVTKIEGGRPTFESARDATGAIVATTFDASGNYAFTSAPSSYPVALVYRVRQKLPDFDSLASNIVGEYDTDDGLLVPSKTVTSHYTVLETDYFIRVDSLTPVNITLPAVIQGKVLVIKSMNTGDVTLIGTIDGNPSVLMKHQYESLTLVGSGTEWSIV